MYVGVLQVTGDMNSTLTSASASCRNNYPNQTIELIEGLIPLFAAIGIVLLMFCCLCLCRVADCCKERRATHLIFRGDMILLIHIAQPLTSQYVLIPNETIVPHSFSLTMRLTRLT